MKQRAGLSASKWFNILLFGLVGQIAWNVENMYFNLFLYNSVYSGASQTAVDGSVSVMDAISKMVAYSAVTAVVTTFVIGIISDRVNTRKWFISIGYILWGAVTASFGLISRSRIAALFSLSDEVKILSATVTAVIVMDCVMTFMGSTSNDSAFNAWVTDITDTKNRATVESVLAIFPVVAMAVVMAAGGMIVGAVGYEMFFLGLGVFVAVCGVVGLFTVKDSREGKKAEEKTSFYREFIYGFRPVVIKQNSRLYLTLTAVCCFQIAVQVFFPYLFIYLEHSMGFTFDKIIGSLLSGTPAKVAVKLVITVAAAAAVVAAIVLVGRLIDKVGKNRFIYISVALFTAGLLFTGFVTTAGLFAAGIGVTFAGYGLLMILLNAAVRDFTPEDKTGMFQGIRMIFSVMLPMIIGPVIGSRVCELSGTVYVNEYNVTTPAPGNEMFFAAAAVGVLIIAPVLALRKKGFEK